MSPIKIRISYLVKPFGDAQGKLLAYCIKAKNYKLVPTGQAGEALFLS